jgi:hypothetical protein
MRANTVEVFCVTARSRKSFVKRCDLFHFLFLRAGLVDGKVLESKICLSRAEFDCKHRGAGLALQLGFHL